MNTPDARQPQSPLTDPEVESLLKDFFAREVPREFIFPRLTIVSRATHESNIAGQPVRTTRSSSLAVATVVCALAVVGWLSRGEFSASQSPNDITHTTQPEGAGADERKSTPDETIPVEERSHLKYTRVIVEDPQTGRKVEVMIPELEIELYPPDQPRPAKLPESP